MKNFKYRIVSLVFFAVCVAGAVAAAIKLDPIESQQRVGSTLVVRYESGLVTTNSLFLAMSPEIKKEINRIETEKAMSRTLGEVIADTRKNIPETAGLEDKAVAFLYLSQMKKDATTLSALSPTNTLEYLIGTGMREDLKKGNE